MFDSFSGRKTVLCGQRLPASAERLAILDDHRARLRAFDQLVASAAQCGIATNPDRHLVLLPEDAVSLLEGAGPAWFALSRAIHALRSTLPILDLALFGFTAEAEDPFDADTARLQRLGSGVEALAFVDDEGSVYKYFLFREDGSVGATFRFSAGDEHFIHAQACTGGYRQLLGKLAVLHALGGMPTEIPGVTSDGILVTKQTRGKTLTPGTDMSKLLPTHLIPIPSRFLRCDRDHPRLAFVEGAPWLVADLHDRNLVLDEAGVPRIIDFVAAPLAGGLIEQFPLLGDWLERVRKNPGATSLEDAPDAEL